MIVTFEDELGYGFSLGSPLTRTVSSAWPVPSALVTEQTKVVLIDSSTVWIRSWVSWATAEGGKGPMVVLQLYPVGSGLLRMSQFSVASLRPRYQLSS